MFADGIAFSGTHFVWLIALFLTLHPVTWPMAGRWRWQASPGLCMGLFVGKWIDIGKGMRAARIGYGAMVLSAVAKCFGFQHAMECGAANATDSAAWPSYATALNSQVYNLARQSPCALRFHVVAEGGWDLGMAVGCGFASGLLLLSWLRLLLAFGYGDCRLHVGYVLLAPHAWR